MPVHRIYKAASPYNSSELLGVDHEQTADVLYLAHLNHAPTKLIRASHTDWTFQTVTFGPSIPVPTGIAGVATTPNTDSANEGNAYFPQPSTYAVTSYSETTGQESRASSSVTLTNDPGLKRNYNTINWAAVTGATGYRIYKAENSQLYGYIGTTDQLTFRDDNIGPDLSQGPPIGDNPFSAAGDYPSALAFHEQRSFWGQTTNLPNGVWGSRSADYENMDFSRPQREDDGLAIGLVGNKVNVVNRLVSSKQGLLALTSNNIFSIQGSNEDYITATPPPRVRPEVRRGASNLKPIPLDSVLFYETAKNGEIRSMGYEFEADGMKSDDLTIFSRHLFEKHGIRAWAFAEKPASAIWVVRDDGKLACMTWDQAQQVWGWTICHTGELDASGNAVDKFIDVSPVTEQGEDRVYFLVSRVVGGVTKLYVERMASELWKKQADACYLDSARSFVNASAVTVVDRLDHLEGRTVKALVDGNVVTRNAGQPLVVTGGKITLPFGGYKITVGLPFTALVETLPLAIQVRADWTVARPQQADKVVLRVVKTRNLEAGPHDRLDANGDDAAMFPVKQRGFEDYEDPIALKTGDFEVDMAGSSGNETVVVIRSPDPTPMHLAAVLIQPGIEGS